MPYSPPPELDGMTLAQIATWADEQTLPPIAAWQPERTGDSEMRIAADGRWFHQGGEIRRTAMVRAFSRILRRDENGTFWLVTPFEKLSIQVEDAPLLAVEMSRKNDGQQDIIVFRCNTDDFVPVGPDNPLIVRGTRDEPRIYVEVRNGLEARLNRPAFYALAEIALDRSDGTVPGVESGGAFFSLEAVA